MKELKIQVRKEFFDDIVSNKTDHCQVKLTQAMRKKVYGDDNVLKTFDKVIINCMFSQDYVERNISKIEVTIGYLCVYFANEEVVNEPVKEVEKKDISVEIVNETEANVKVEESIKEIEVTIPEKVEKHIDMKKEVDKILDEVCKNERVVTVGIPKVIIKPNGVIFGQRKKLPIRNDHEIRFDIEHDSFYFTYDMTEEEFIEQMKDFFKKMIRSNFVFLWRNKSGYVEKDGKRFLSLYYTTRRYVNESGMRY